MLAGKTILLTAGPTIEPIDPVRYISNYSTGKMGFAIANELVKRKAKVILICGPVNLEIDNPLVQTIKVLTAADMFDACLSHFPACDGAIMAAAVADYTVASPSRLKMKKKVDEDYLILKFVKTKDIAAHLGKMKNERQVLAGFSLETNDEIVHALQKLKSKNLDFVVLNSLREKGAGFSFDTNKITIIDKRGRIVEYPLKSKQEVAVDIIDFFETFYL